MYTFFDLLRLIYTGGGAMSQNKLMDELNEELNILYRFLVSKGVPYIDAEDVVQETAYKFLRFSDTIKSSHIRSWLIRVALNIYYDQCRKNKKYILNLDDNINLTESDDLPLFTLIAKEQTEEINQLLRKLKPMYAELLSLKYQSELSYNEISAILGIKKSSIKVKLFRARKKLLELYEEGKREKE